MRSIISDCGRLITEVRKICPLVHNITNYVTVNDVANIELAMGASPIMADDSLEAADITNISKALVLNIGTLNTRTIQSMIISGKMANFRKIPVIFDPVGAGASPLRNQTVEKILSSVKCSVIRGNLSELAFIAGLSVSTKGVDTADEDEGISKTSVAEKVALKYGCVAAITGAVDVISDGTRTVEISNGNPMLKKVTGTGCMTSGMVGGYSCAGDAFTAAVTAIAAMGIAGEISFEKYGSLGTGSFHTGLIDAVSILDEDTFVKRAKINEL